MGCPELQAVMMWVDALGRLCRAVPNACKVRTRPYDVAPPHQNAHA